MFRNIRVINCISAYVLVQVKSKKKIKVYDTYENGVYIFLIVCYTFK